MAQEHAQKNDQKSEDEPVRQEGKDLRDATLSDAVDDILDEIDNVLEENAEEFVKSYVQKGGQ
jgi:prokaryotic ubiquitin-like protein Pup